MMQNTLEKALQEVQIKSRKLINLDEKKINQVLLDLANTLVKNQKKILEANQKDLAKMDKNDPKYDRLLLNEQRILGISSDIKNVTKLKSPIGTILEKKVLPNKLKLEKKVVPLGVIGIIYEARPNVTFDCFSLCFKTFNACVLKGGSDATNSNIASVKLIQEVLRKNKIDPEIIFLVPNEKNNVIKILKAVSYIDVIIPRGSNRLINFVRENAKVPVIETGAGVCHTYFEKTGNLKYGKQIIENAKTRRPSVCNTLDTVIIDETKLKDLPNLVSDLSKHQVQIFCDEKSFKILDKNYPKELLKKAKNSDFGREFLSLKMSIKTVKNSDEAIAHITKFGSKHSESIISSDKKIIEIFLKNIDAACVYVNTSTAFTDGGQFGLGAEIGISTQKLHARGPMALKELTSYKWIIRGNGQIRSN